jgi:galactokinase/mevalonate kinase-like predicted kinase
MARVRTATRVSKNIIWFDGEMWSELEMGRFCSLIGGGYCRIGKDADPPGKQLGSSEAINVSVSALLNALNCISCL